jgi:hypothetical protein
LHSNLGPHSPFTRGEVTRGLLRTLLDCVPDSPNDLGAEMLHDLVRAVGAVLAERPTDAQLDRLGILARAATDSKWLDEWNVRAAGYVLMQRMGAADADREGMSAPQGT